MFLLACFCGLQVRFPVAMEITDAGPQVAASRSSRTTSPRPSSPSRLRMMTSLAWTSTWTPWRHHLTVNLCPSPSTTWKVKFRQTASLPVTFSRASRRCPLDDLQRLGVGSQPRRGVRSSRGSRFDSQSGSGSGAGADQPGLGALEHEDMVDKQGTRWRSFTTGDPPQENWVNMSVLEPFLRVLSHGGTDCPSPKGHLNPT